MYVPPSLVTSPSGTAGMAGDLDSAVRIEEGGDEGRVGWTTIPSGGSPIDDRDEDEDEDEDDEDEDDGDGGTVEDGDVAMDGTGDDGNIDGGCGRVTCTSSSFISRSG